MFPPLMRKNMSKHTLQELQQWQALPLNIKVLMTKDRIRQWIKEYGEDGVYVSFSGGKDSTVLLDLVRQDYPNVKAMFVDVPTQYPELKQFVQTFDNVDMTYPKTSFVKVCETYGFPLVSKEGAESIEGARKYLTSILNEMNAPTDRQTDSTRISISTIECADKASMQSPTRGGKTTSIEKSEELASILNNRMKHRKGGSNQRLAIMLGWLTKNSTIKANIPKQDRSNFALTKWKFTLDAPFEISNKCCDVMKKEPAHNYFIKTGRKPITAQMASESRLRKQKWIQNGCNGFDLKIPTSNPMAFWTENDVLEYIVTRNIPICSVYGDVVEDYGNDVEGQMHLADFGIGEKYTKYKCTGCQRTGCCLCGFGCHLDKPGKGRFEMLKETHRGMYDLLDVIKNNGVTYREAIDWMNEHGNLNIRY